MQPIIHRPEPDRTATHLAILTPSRGRPERMAEMVTAVEATARGQWLIWLGVDDDDPALPRYLELFAGHARVMVCPGPRRNLVEWTNHLAKLAISLHAFGTTHLASLGDDHLPRTPGWDAALIQASELNGPGYAFGHDLLRPDLPTAWVQGVAIYEALGWMMLPQCQHLYVDNVVLDLGQAAGRITRRGDVAIEHMHPAAGKAAEDDSYRASNSDAQIARDRAAYEAWVRDGLQRDAETIRGLR